MLYEPAPVVLVEVILFAFTFFTIFLKRRMTGTAELPDWSRDTSLSKYCYFLSIDWNFIISQNLSMQF